MNFKDEVDFISRLSGYGELTRAQSNNLFGINHRGAQSPVPTNTDHYGLTFFTRPRLNLSYDNLIANRVFSTLAASNDTNRDSGTLPKAIRCLLDSTLGQRDITSPLVDDKLAFIPMLTNNLISISGWPDIAVDTYTSKEGIYKEAYSMVDGTAEIFNTYELTATFRNIAGDPISLLFTIWVLYEALVYNGEMTPYPDAIIQNEIDYQTRIYRLVLDPQMKFVQKIGACGAAFPMASPLGASFNFTHDTPYIRDNDQISIPFRAIGANYLDPILIKEFNQVVTEFNPGMKDSGRSLYYAKLRDNEYRYFNYSGYPRINPTTYELEWWVDKNDYAAFRDQLGVTNESGQQA